MGVAVQRPRQPEHWGNADPRRAPGVHPDDAVGPPVHILWGRGWTNQIAKTATVALLSAPQRSAQRRGMYLVPRKSDVLPHATSTPFRIEIKPKRTAGPVSESAKINRKNNLRNRTWEPSAGRGGKGTSKDASEPPGSHKAASLVGSTCAARSGFSFADHHGNSHYGLTSQAIAAHWPLLKIACLELAK